MIAACLLALLIPIVSLLLLRYCPSRRFDIFQLTLLLFNFLNVSRATMLLLSLDDPYPDGYVRQPDDQLVAALLTGLVWIIVLGVVMALLSRFQPRASRLFPPPISAAAVGPVLVVSCVLAGLSLLVTGWLSLRAGGVLELPRFLKVERQGAGLYALRQFGALGMFLCLAAYFSLSDRRRTWRLAMLGLAALAGFNTYLWGGREMLAAAFIYFVLAAHFLRGTSLLRVGTYSLAGCAGLFLLSIFRGLLIADHVNLFEQGNVWRQISISLHHTRLDAYMLVLDHFDALGGFRWGEDFLNGLGAAVPRVLWEGKPDVTKFGHWLRLNYDHQSRNGWPVEAYASWYINFGYAGLVAGAGATAYVFRAIQLRYQDLHKNPFALAYSVVLATLVFQGGLGPGSFVGCVLWVVPLFSLWFFCDALQRVRFTWGSESRRLPSRKAYRRVRFGGGPRLTRRKVLPR